LCILLDQNPPELASMHSRVDEHSENVKRRTESFLSEDMSGHMFEDTIPLELRCPLCGDLNIYDVESIYVNSKRQNEEPFVADAIRCSSCGKKPEFEFTTKAFMSITAELMRVLSLKDRGRKVKSPIKFVELRLVDGRSMSLRETIEYYRHELEENPESVVDLIGLGNTYVKINRERQAEECFRKCFDIDKCCVEAAASLAQIRADNGDLTGALQILDESLIYKDGWQCHRLDRITPKEYVRRIVDFYNQIRQELGINKPPLQMSFFSKQTRCDVGRNDPCPCGSGKKYKKCCLSKTQ
jgi:tetratricopeptide (TPR) repeat protein